MKITKRQVKEALGFTTDVEVANFFNTSKQAVGAWGDDDALPDGRQWQAIALRPDIFGTPSRATKRPTDIPTKPAKQEAA